ncbi:MAG: hypothetical protein CMJ83_19555 [Planctomycetes bacterium]|nr:hypothetical protein [Planctomycetota bacterium]
MPGPLENLPRFRFDNGDGPTYDVEWPDRISPLGGAVDALSYRGGRGGTAATFFSGGYRVLYLGFPFETIRRPGLRARLMRDAVRALVR